MFEQVNLKTCLNLKQTPVVYALLTGPTNNRLKVGSTGNLRARMAKFARAKWFEQQMTVTYFTMASKSHAVIVERWVQYLLMDRWLWREVFQVTIDQFSIAVHRGLDCVYRHSHTDSNEGLPSPFG